MPRIGGGRGPMVPPGTQGAGQAPAAQKSDFASKVNQVAQAATTQGTDAARATQGAKAAQSELTGKVKDIARKFANGNLNQKEATREFVSLVIEERFPQFKKKKKKKKKDPDEKGKEGGGDDEPEDAQERLEVAVTELIDRDPSLAKKLSTQFRKLAKG